MASEMELIFNQDCHLTECMRLRVKSLEQKSQRPQDGEKLLLPNEYVYRLDFSEQQLKFLRWNINLNAIGKIIITGTSQHYTPDLTNLMTRQLLDPSGIFWKTEEGGEVDHYEADTQEFGERIADLARIRKVMYFLVTFQGDITPDDINCSIIFKV
ncbi:olfactory marker protein-like [Polypterus senegalus]